MPLEITWDDAGHKFVKTRSPTRGVSAPFPSRSWKVKNDILAFSCYKLQTR